ncbi:hypothetical protein AKO1_012379 [Acrasis kona]|uniref:Uncharacterized protein n=1 Tax=Acrasis kona TaxID=1008807 RepID=A0AAW2YXK7_9EUKA
MSKHKREKHDHENEPEQKKQKIEDEIIEMGHIYFFYRPKVDLESAEGPDDVQKFYLLVKPLDKGASRLINMLKKKLPDITKHERLLGVVEKTSPNVKQIVEESLSIEINHNKTKDDTTAQPARPVGEGFYAIVTHEKNTRLAYILEVPNKLSKVQSSFNIESEGCFVVSVKNPEKEDAAGVVSKSEKPEFDDSLQEMFHNRKWAPITSTDFLNVEGAEILFVGANHDVEYLGNVGEQVEEEAENDIHKNHPDPKSIFQELHLKRSEHPIESLTKGEWS